MYTLRQKHPFAALIACAVAALWLTGGADLPQNEPQDHPAEVQETQVPAEPVHISFYQFWHDFLEKDVSKAG
jgi:hypothetical protein